MSTTARKRAFCDGCEGPPVEIEYSLIDPDCRWTCPDCGAEGRLWYDGGWKTWPGWTLLDGSESPELGAPDAVGRGVSSRASHPLEGR